jgi:LysM repeat protein
MAEVAEKMEELTVPEGGIADFVMDDDELEEAYGEKASDFGDDGIAQFPALAERMAKYGRNEDNMLAHVAEGELVIPAQFLQDEVMKQRIYDLLTEAGVEDPEAYVVGAEANDINPTTGLPEFFLKKLFKKVVKGIKKVVKSVVKIIKKVAPIVLPIAMPFLFPVLGPMYGAALGSGIGTLINGGSIKDALKSALISGAVGAVAGGFTGKTGEGFLANVADAANPQRLSQFGQNLSEGISSGSFSGFTEAVGRDFKAVTDPLAGGGAGGAGNAAATQQIQSGDTLSKIAADNNTTVQALMDANPNITDPNVIQAGDTINLPQAGGGAGAGAGGAGAGETLAGAERNFLEKTGDYMFRGGKSPAEIAAAQSVAENSAIQQTLTKYGHAGTLSTAPDAIQQAAIAAGNAASAAAAPGMLAKFGPSLAAGTLAMGATGMFEVPEPEQASFIDYNPDGTPVTGQDLIDADPSRYLIADLGRKRLNPETGEYEDVEVDLTVPAPDTSPYTVPTQYPVTPPPGGYGVNSSAGYLLASNPGGPFARPYVTAAQGGAIPEVFPRRNGGIMPNEGTPGEDSVRAMLMPGEFVMTTDAVRGLGNGNLNNGIKNMYSVMRNLESRGRAMA